MVQRLPGLSNSSCLECNTSDSRGDQTPTCGNYFAILRYTKRQMKAQCYAWCCSWREASVWGSSAAAALPRLEVRVENSMHHTFDHNVRKRVWQCENKDFEIKIESSYIPVTHWCIITGISCGLAGLTVCRRQQVRVPQKQQDWLVCEFAGRRAEVRRSVGGYVPLLNHQD